MKSITDMSTDELRAHIEESARIYRTHHWLYGTRVVYCTRCGASPTEGRQMECPS